MDSEDWSAFCEKVKEYEMCGDANATTMLAVNAMVDAGNEDENERKSVESAVKALLKGKTGNPFRGGRGDILSFTQKNGVSEAFGPFRDALAGAFEALPLFNAVIRPHGRTKKANYDTGEAFANAILMKAMENIKNLAKAGELDALL
jgi:hypothetical protein